MHRCTDRACWKCGQQVHHYRRSWFYLNIQPCALALAYPRLVVSEKPGKSPKLIYLRRKAPMVAKRHYVEKNGHFEICKGSDIPN